MSSVLQYGKQPQQLVVAPPKTQFFHSFWCDMWRQIEVTYTREGCWEWGLSADLKLGCWCVANWERFLEYMEQRLEQRGNYSRLECRKFGAGHGYRELGIDVRRKVSNMNHIHILNHFGRSFATLMLTIIIILAIIMITDEGLRLSAVCSTSTTQSQSAPMPGQRSPLGQHLRSSPRCGSHQAANQTKETPAN